MLLQVHAVTLLIAAAAFTDTAQEEKLAALEAENLRLRVHLSQELDLLEKINEQQRRRLKQQEAERRPGPRRRLSAAGGSGGTGNFLHKGTVHSFADADTCLGTDGPLTVHNTAGVPLCGLNNTPFPPLTRPLTTFAAASSSCFPWQPARSSSSAPRWKRSGCPRPSPCTTERPARPIGRRPGST